MNCPLCESNDINTIEKIDAKSLIKLYEKMTDIDFSYLIYQDIEYCECQHCKLRYFNPLITGDEQFYNSLQKFDWYYMNEKDEYNEAKKYIKATDRVLEVGSGKGAFAKDLPTKDYVGLDFSLKAKEMAAENGIFIENEMVQDYADKNLNKFDIVVSFQVLEHIPNPKSFLEAKLKALKIGGKMIIAVPSEDSFLKYVTNGILNMPPHHVTRWSDDTLRYIADEYNLELLALQHEKVQKTHELLYVSTSIENSLLKPRLLDISFLRKAISKLVSIYSKVLVKGVNKEISSNGHTVIAVYQKK
ncbi:class I SAM-dependent methyltransferase [Sulfurovum sp.]|uniref:class I SAM-dependent methyltransferase n=1 Tax=Sulfurovum sp. TaxID=1969726 RepID=UPI0035698C8D